MKGKNLKQLLNNQKAKRVGCILLAAAVLGTGAWAKIASMERYPSLDPSG